MKTRVRGLGVALATLLVAGGVLADPPGTRAPGFALEGTSGATRRLRDYRGRVVILVYEDRDASHQNDPLKAELARRARATDITRDVTLLPVADLRDYDFWPARGYARDAVVDIAREQGVEILIDWTGSMGRSYGFIPGRSSVTVIGRDGRVLYQHAGALGRGQWASFFGAIEREVARTVTPDESGRPAAP